MRPCRLLCVGTINTLEYRRNSLSLSVDPIKRPINHLLVLLSADVQTSTTSTYTCDFRWKHLDAEEILLPAHTGRSQKATFGMETDRYTLIIQLPQEVEPIYFAGVEWFPFEPQRQWCDQNYKTSTRSSGWHAEFQGVKSQIIWAQLVQNRELHHSQQLAGVSC